MVWWQYVIGIAVVASLCFYTWRRGWIEGYVQANMDIEALANEANWYDDEDVIIEDGLALVDEMTRFEQEDRENDAMLHALRERMAERSELVIAGRSEANNGVINRDATTPNER